MQRQGSCESNHRLARERDGILGRGATRELCIFLETVDPHHDGFTEYRSGGIKYHRPMSGKYRCPGHKGTSQSQHTSLLISSCACHQNQANVCDVLLAPLVCGGVFFLSTQKSIASCLVALLHLVVYVVRSLTQCQCT